MKKTSILLFALVLGVAFNALSQVSSFADFFVGKWEILITGTPNGDAKLVANLTRKDGKLTGNLTNPAEADKAPIPITSIEEGTDKLSMAFTAQGYDVTLDLAKVDDDNLKGSLMNMFDAKAKRLKE